MKPCPPPPDKETLLKYMVQVEKAKGKKFGIDFRHTPDKAWMLACISTYLPDHSIFGKSYVAPPRREKLVNKAEVEWPTNFLQGLPPSRKKGR